MKKGVPKSRNRIPPPPHEDKGAEESADWILCKHFPYFERAEKQMILEAMQEYASQERLKAIQECQDCFAPVFKIEPKPENTLQIIEAFRDGFRELEKLKNK